MGKLYRSTAVRDTEQEWHEAALVFGRTRTCDYLLITDGDTFLMRDAVVNLQRTKNVVSAPLVNAPLDSGSNMEGLLDEDYVLRKRVEKTRVRMTFAMFHLRECTSLFRFTILAGRSSSI